MSDQNEPPISAWDADSIKQERQEERRVMSERNEKVSVETNTRCTYATHGPWINKLGALRCERCDLTPTAAWRVAVTTVADRDAQVAEMRAVHEQINNEWLTKADGVRAQMATLTRQLATAREIAVGVAAGLRTIPGLVAENGWSLTMTADVLHDYANTLAAIDAPAGEVTVSHSDWCLAITCSSCGARCQRKSGHGPWFGVPHAGKCAANCRNAPPPKSAAEHRETCSVVGWCDGHHVDHGHPGSPNATPVGYEECSDCDANGQYHRDGVSHCAKCGWPQFDCNGHPEPANAQGSEAAPVATSLAEAFAAAHPEGVAIESWPSSIPPFTSKEARLEAAWCEQNCDSGGKLLPRLASTLRRYADLLERGDALERGGRGNVGRS